MTRSNLLIRGNPIPNSYGTMKNSKPTKTTLIKKNTAGGITLTDIKLHYKAMVLKTVLSWHKNKYIDQWSGIESPQRNPRICGQLTLNEGVKDTQWGKTVSSTNAVGITEDPHAKE